MRRRWATDDDDLLREHIANGLSIVKTAKAMGRAETTVVEHAKQLGLNWSRSATPQAIAATRADERARRVRFRDDLMTDLERLRAQLFAPTLVHSFGGRGNTLATATLDQPAIADQLRLVQAISAGMATLERLEALDSKEGVGDAVGMLDQIAQAIAKAAEELAATPTTPQASASTPRR